MARSQDVAEWESQAKVIADAVLSRLLETSAAELPAAPAVPAELQSAWTRAMELAGGRDGHAAPGAAERVYLRAAGRALAAALASQPARWRELIQTSKERNLLDSFVAALPENDVLAAAPALASEVINVGVAGAIDTFGDLRGVSPEAIAEYLESRRQAAATMWDFTADLERTASTASLSSPVFWLVRILRRAGPRAWWDWFRRENPVVAATSLHFLGDIEWAWRVLDEAARDVRDPETLLYATLLARAALDVVVRADRDVRVAFNGVAVTEPAVGNQGTIDLEAWTQHELPAVVSRFAERALLLEPAGLPYELLCGVSFRTGSEVFRALRWAVAKALVDAKGFDAAVQTVTRISGARDAALVAATLYWIDGPHQAVGTATEVVLGALDDWLTQSEHVSLAGTPDEEELLWAAAGALAAHPDPRERWTASLAKVYREFEGWGASFEQAHRAIGKIAALIIEGAMATEWLMQRSEQAIARELFSLVWARAHMWVRNIVGTYASDDVQRALVRLWARLQLVMGHDAERLAAAELSRFDSVELLLACSRTWQQNRGGDEATQQLPESANATLKLRLDDLLPAWQLLGHVTDAEREWVHEASSALGVGS